MTSSCCQSARCPSTKAFSGAADRPECVQVMDDVILLPERPMSLYEGLSGAVCFWTDLLAPELSHLPGYELPHPMRLALHRAQSAQAMGQQPPSNGAVARSQSAAALMHSRTASTPALSEEAHAHARQHRRQPSNAGSSRNASYGNLAAQQAGASPPQDARPAAGPAPARRAARPGGRVRASHGGGGSGSSQQVFSDGQSGLSGGPTDASSASAQLPPRAALSRQGSDAHAAQRAAARRAPPPDDGDNLRVTRRAPPPDDGDHLCVTRRTPSSRSNIPSLQVRFQRCVQKRRGVVRTRRGHAHSVAAGALQRCLQKRRDVVRNTAQWAPDMLTASRQVHCRCTAAQVVLVWSQLGRVRCSQPPASRQRNLQLRYCV